jgi:glycosyltransferase involved in cell wall biosynthesis
MPDPTTILVSGWRSIPHSYAVTNQFQCLELLRRPQVQLFFEDTPYYRPEWKATSGLLKPAEEAAIRSIPSLPAKQSVDAEYRIAFPLDVLRAPRARRVGVFGTSEHRRVTPSFIAGNVPVSAAMRASPQSVIITPSKWSREGFIASDAPPDRVMVVPLGVDPQLFQPPDAQQRHAARQRIGLESSDDFVFLNLSAMTGNKGMTLLFPAFARVLDRHPTARLVLKGLDPLYNSKQILTSQMQGMRQADVQRVLPRLIYIGDQLSFADIVRLYHLADCYVSPYTAEGFNLPALEAAACGLPVICTANGPTDDFVTPDFALAIPSTVTEFPGGPGQQSGHYLAPSIQHLQQFMLDVIEKPEIRQRARETGPAHVGQHNTWKHVVDQLLTVLLA